MPEDPRGFAFDHLEPVTEPETDSDNLARLWQRLINQEQWTEAAEKD